MAYKPPQTPPFVLIAFASVHVVAAAVDLAFGLSTIGTNASAAFLNAVRIVVAVSFIWLAGTLPLQLILPGTNVASSTDVRLNDYTMIFIS